MEITFDQHIGIFENAVPKEWCEKVIDVYETSIYKPVNRQDSDSVFISEKDDNFLPLHLSNENLAREFSHNFFKNFYPQYLNHYKIDSTILTDLIFLDDFKIQKTLPSQGYHIWHIENGFNMVEISRRIMVYTIYLNDVEEGGETEFLIQSKRVKPKQGTLCIFPASYTHIHRGNPPLKGTKYILTGWISYLPEDQINE